MNPEMMSKNVFLLVGATVLIGCSASTSVDEAPPSMSEIAEQAEAEVSDPLFRDESDKTGLVHHHFSGTTGDYLFAEILGSGVALFDYDNDGDLDVYLVQGGMLDPEKTMGDCLFPPPADQPSGNRLFRNELSETGSLRFVDVTAAAGVAGTGYGMGVAVGDYDNDGDEDLYVTNLADNLMLRNNGDGTFADVTSESGANVDTWSTSAAFVDYDK